MRRAGRRRLAVVIVMAVATLGLTPSARAQAGGTLAGVQLGVSTRPDTVTVGDPLELRIRVRAPAGATIVFPDGPDSSAQVEAIASRALLGAANAGGTDQTAVYRLVAWEIGAVPAKLGDVVVTLAGAERRISLGNVTVTVRSVLPADTTLRVPKPPRPPLDVVIPWWRTWLPWMLAALALLGLIAWWWRRRRRGTAMQATAVDAHAFAEREFARIEALGLVDAGERGRHVALMVEVLRDYLALRLPDARASLTSGELLAALRGSRVVPVERLRGVLDDADMVKFARRVVNADRSRELGRDARAIARDVEASVVATAVAPRREKAA